MINELLAKIVGTEYVITESSALKNAETTNYNTDEKIRCIVKPATEEELQQCVQCANEHNTPVYTVSIGKNWGYGSKVPVQTDNILIDLSRMNKILDYDEELAYVTIEPGVTYDQLYSFLREKNSQLIISTTGSASNSSIIGNAAERGIATGLYADRFANVCALNILLANGDFISTGLERFGDQKIGKLHKWGIGPAVDGLFSQSNMGIITRLTLWLMKIPAHFGLGFYHLGLPEQLEKVIDNLREMCMDGLLRPTVTLYNDTRILQSLIQYPFDHFSPEKNSQDEVMQFIKDNSPVGKMVGVWNGEISLRGSSAEHLRIQKDLVKSRMEPLVDEINFVEVSKEQILETLNNPNDTLGKQVTLQSFLQRKYVGIPDNSALRQVYWRKRTPVPQHIDPDLDMCGTVWICPAVPFVGKDVLKATETIKEIINKYHFEAAISLQCMSERYINIIASFVWDRAVEGEDQKAEKCYFDAKNALKQSGYFPYRTTTLDMDSEKVNDNYTNFIFNIKKAIDPKNILSPGRYVI